MRIVKEWPDLDNEVRRLQERVAAQKPSSKDSQESTEPTGRVNAFSRTDASSAVAVWPLALAKGATLRFRKGLAVAKAFPTPPPLMIIVLVKKNR